MNSKQELSILFFEIFLINLITTAFLSIFFLIAVEFVPVLNEEKQLFYWSILYFIFQLFYFEWFFIGVKEFKYIALRSFFIRFLFILFVFLLIKEKADYINYMVMQVILSVTISIINFRQLNRLLTFKKIKFDEIDLRKHIKPLLILFLTIFSISIYFSLDTILLGFLANNESVGYYSSALKLTKLIIAVLGSITVAVFPQMIDVYHNGGEEQFKSLVKKCYDLIVGLSIPLIILLVGLSSEIIQLILGPAFERATLPLIITAPLILIVSLSSIFGFQVLSALSKDKAILFSAIIGMCISILLSFLLIPITKENGAAITILLTELTVSLSFIYFAKKYFPLNGYFNLLLIKLVESLPYLFILIACKYFSSNYLLTIISTSLFSLIWFTAYHFYFNTVNIYQEQVTKLINKFYKR
jgi:O-antigen/teichoic acid export membrane protein